jgi:hypothetical protein
MSNETENVMFITTDTKKVVKTTATATATVLVTTTVFAVAAEIVKPQLRKLNRRLKKENESK